MTASAPSDPDGHSVGTAPARVAYTYPRTPISSALDRDKNRGYIIPEMPHMSIIKPGWSPQRAEYLPATDFSDAAMDNNDWELPSASPTSPPTPPGISDRQASLLSHSGSFSAGNSPVTPPVSTGTGSSYYTLKGLGQYHVPASTPTASVHYPGTVSAPMTPRHSMGSSSMTSAYGGLISPMYGSSVGSCGHASSTSGILHSPSHLNIQPTAQSMSPSSVSSSATKGPHLISSSSQAAGMHTRSYSYAAADRLPQLSGLSLDTAINHRQRAYSSSAAVADWQRLAAPFGPQTHAHLAGNTASPGRKRAVSTVTRMPLQTQPVVMPPPTASPVLSFEATRQTSRGRVPAASSRRSSDASINVASQFANTNAAAQSTQPEVTVDILTASDAQIYTLCRDQRGCRHLQHRLSEGDPAVSTRIFEATVPHIVSLMTDPFGNYFCQKLVEQSSETQLTELVRSCSPQMVDIALNPHGTRALQKTIEVLKNNAQVGIVIEALGNSVVKLIRDLNGNHVIQRILLELNDYGTQFVYDAVCESVIEVGTHRHGCCVLQRCLDYSNPENKHRLVSHIVEEALTLVVDPFGNYVCQYVVDLDVAEYTTALARRLSGHINELSTQKFASNVVEKCLRMAAPAVQRELIREISRPNTLQELLMDSYGNYVVQTALDCCDGNLRRTLATSVHAELSQSRSPYGRRILSKLKSLPA